MKNHRMLAAVAATGAALLALTACGANNGAADNGTTGPTTEQTEAKDHNRADVDFATQMIPHHQQALVMVDMTRGHDLSPEMKQLTEDIKAAQGPEIDLMKGWLKEWGEPVPSSSSDGMGDMEGMDHGGNGSSDMQGMMSNDELDELKSAPGAQFESMWLRMMIKHHEGAIEMAKDEQKDGSFGPALELAKSIATSQQKEIDHMQDLLKS